MYREYFSLKEPPFSIAPDPRYLYLSEQHREALAHLVYGINTEGGFILLTGEVGTGKTTVCRCLLEQIPEKTALAFILNPKMNVEELLATICNELGISYPEGNISIKVFVDKINAYLLDNYARGRKTVLIIEEAQNLSPDVLEQVRLLTNLETNQQKLLQIIMVGQPELNNILSQKELQQYHLGPLSKKDVIAYVNHRLTVAGAHNKLFPDSIMRKLYYASRGIPRLINVICDRALLGAYVEGKELVDKYTLAKATQEVLGALEVKEQKSKIFKWALTSLLVIVSGAALAMAYYNYRSQLSPIRTLSTLNANVKTTELQKFHALHWPPNQPIDQSKDMAYKTLFVQWGIPYEIQGKGTACQQAEAKGLRCLNGPGNLNELIHLNRPAVLTLFDGGREFYAALTEIHGDTARLVIGTETRTVNVKEVEQRWLGDYTLLWRKPQNVKGNIHPGYRGYAVRWLEKQLSIIQGRTIQPVGDLSYDEALVTQVKRFQVSEGLAPDGVVGPQTIIHMNNLVGSNEPNLVKKVDNK
jgi:general secretion pathway protein A